jgi:hypothetical protein
MYSFVPAVVSKSVASIRFGERPVPPTLKTPGISAQTGEPTVPVLTCSLV